MSKEKILQSDLVRYFFKNIRFILILTFSFLILSIIYSLSITNYYKSSAILSDSENNLTNPSITSGVGNLLGFNVANSSPLSKYSLELKSLDFFTILYEDHDFLKKLIAVNDYDQSLKKNFYNEDIFDPKLNDWKFSNDKSKKPHLQSAHSAFLNNLELEITFDLNVLNISYRSISPTVSKEILEKVIFEFNKYKKNQKELKGSEAIDYLENLLMSSSRSSIKTLASEVIRRELGKAAYSNIPSYNFLEIIQSPYVPIYKSGPNRPLIVVLFTFFGFFLSVFIVILRVFFDI